MRRETHPAFGAVGSELHVGFFGILKASPIVLTFPISRTHFAPSVPCLPGESRTGSHDLLNFSVNLPPTRGWDLALSDFGFERIP